MDSSNVVIKAEMITTSLFDENYTSYQPYNNGWNTISVHEYHGYTSSSAERKPSLAISDFSPYQNVRMTFNNNITCEDEAPHAMNHQRQNHYFVPKLPKKVHFVEQEKHTEFVDPKNGKKVVVRNESVDEVAEGFIMQKHKKFELSKWDTFKEV